MSIKIKVCALELPAKCTRVQMINSVPFAVSKECEECLYKVIAEVINAEGSNKTAKERGYSKFNKSTRTAAGVYVRNKENGYTKFIFDVPETWLPNPREVVETVTNPSRSSFLPFWQHRVRAYPIIVV